MLSVRLHARSRHQGQCDAEGRSAHAATTSDSIGLKPLTLSTLVNTVRASGHHAEADLTTDLGRSGYLDVRQTACGDERRPGGTFVTFGLMGVGCMHSMHEDYQRLHGRLGWLDSGHKSDLSREVTSVGTVILRPDELRMQFLLDGAPYEVALRKGSGERFRGTWERGRPGGIEERGTAECSLAFDTADTGIVKLEGKWFEGIDWEWYGRLEYSTCASTRAEP